MPLYLSNGDSSFKMHPKYSRKHNSSTLSPLSIHRCGYLIKHLPAGVMLFTIVYRGCDPFLTATKFQPPHDFAALVSCLYESGGKAHKSPTIQWYCRITVQHLLFRPFVAYKNDNHTHTHTGWETICHLFFEPSSNWRRNLKIITL